MDTQTHVWTIPPERMKMKREHRVPPCRRALDILDAARTLDDRDNLRERRTVPMGALLPPSSESLRS